MEAQFAFRFRALPQRCNKTVNAEVAFFNRVLPQTVNRMNDRNIVVLNGDRRRRRRWRNRAVHYGTRDVTDDVIGIRIVIVIITDDVINSLTVATPGLSSRIWELALSSFLDRQKQPKQGLLAKHGYHASRGKGSSALAGILAGALGKTFGPWVKKSPERGPRPEIHLPCASSATSFTAFYQCSSMRYLPRQLVSRRPRSRQGSVREQNDCNDEENPNDEDEEATVTDQQEESVSDSDVLSAISKLRIFLGRCASAT
ncbi:hypothetical protein HPB47_015449 [Ixodes persulcatus]|uniref:Uncharacterized protein n=1 Tax=Ixodes persulcatus TaxID=34615 RepID=A0AC60QW26_IXOPE|nr:hypothetical protein HPB47_015449 [Ixodes persulcatus]